MAFKHLRRRCLILAATIACAVMLTGTDVIPAQEDDRPKSSDDLEQQSPSPDERKPINGYPVRMRRIGTPMDVDYDLDNSFPKSGSLLELILECDESQQQ